MTAPARVLVADDHAPTREDVRAALDGDPRFTVVAVAADAADAVSAAVRERPDVALLDMRMPGNGAAAAWEITARLPGTRVVMLTISRSDDDLFAALRAGVSGYLLKDVSAQELVNAARLAIEGKAVIHPTLTRAFIEEVQLVDRRPEAPLSKREAEILQMVAYGSTTKEVAHDLGISPHTVKTHLERIFEKLGANDRAQAVAIAIRQGIVE